MNDKAKFDTAATAKAFMLAGNATVTLVSLRTGTRFTYKLRASDDGQCHFVSLLSGPDNESDYKYLGRIARDIFFAGRKSPRAGDIGANAPSSLGFAFTWQALVQDVLPASLEIWHEGKCGRCNRKLTVPSSIASGFGPECADRIGVSAMREDYGA